MADKTDDDSEKKTSKYTQDDFEEEFEFDTEEMLAEDLFAQEKQPDLNDASSQKTDTTTGHAQQSSSLLPIAITCTLLGFAGYQGYQYFFGTNQKKEATTTTDDATRTIQEAPAALYADPFPKTEANTSDTTVQTESTTGMLESKPSLIEKEGPASPTQPPVPELTETVPIPVQPLPEQPSSVQPSDTPSPEETTLPAGASTEINHDSILKQIKKQLTEQEKQFEKQVQYLEEKINSMERHIQMNNKNMIEIQHDFNTLNAGLNAFNEQLQSLRETQRKKQKAIQKSSTPHTAVMPKPTNPQYTVYAIIPGRAWLRSHDGKTITVSEGDTIKEYGKVLKIDAGEGIVVTSSGIMLR